MDWQPIETAPMDKYILLYSASGRINVAIFAESKGGPYLWYLADSFSVVRNPTHWMPLPQPPKDTQ